MSSTSLVTDGYICYPRKIFVPQPSSTRSPEIVGVDELQPGIRNIEAPDEGQPAPTVLAAQPLIPELSGQTPAAPVTSSPSTISAQDLRPSIERVEED